jgi:hypothetical protein
MHTCARTSHQCAGVVILSFYLLVLFLKIIGVSAED